MPKNQEISPFLGSFLSLPNSSFDYIKAKVVILPVPYGVTTTYGEGIRAAPESIIQASRELELWDEELRIDISLAVPICTFTPLEPVVSSPEDMVRKVKEVYSLLMEEGKFVVLLGGEHTLSIGAVKALREKYPNLSVLPLDAHLDLRDEYQGSKYSHACTLRRIAEMVPIFPVGIRSLSEEEFEYLHKNKLPVFYMQDIQRNERWLNEVVSQLSENVYLTIDLDVFDPSIMPAVGTPEPGGLDWYEMLKFLRSIAQNKRIVGFDVVEGSPIPNLKAPDFLVARLIYKLIGYIFRLNTIRP